MFGKVGKKVKFTRRVGCNSEDVGDVLPIDRYYKITKQRKRQRLNKQFYNEMEGELKEREEAAECKPELQYTRDELLKYAEHPCSKRKPVISDPVVDNLSCWSKSGKRSDTPTEETFKRRSNDPRERLRKEQDGIVLSPQRRSFNNGCFVTASSSNQSDTQQPQQQQQQQQHSSSMNNKDNHRDCGGTVQGRRVGSGRILNRDWDFRDKENNDNDNTYMFRSSNSRDLADRYDVRRNYSSLTIESSRGGGGGGDPRVRERNSRYPGGGDRRRYESEEPEWFTGGPTSQHETIELRGFEEINEPGGAGARSKAKVISKPSSKIDMRDSNLNSRNISGAPGGMDDHSLRNNERSAGGGGEGTFSEPPQSSSSPVTTDLSPNNGTNSGDHPLQPGGHDFNFEDILQLDNLPILANGGAGEAACSGSRFSQFFRRDSPLLQQQLHQSHGDQDDTRRSSLQDDFIKNIINDTNETSSYFAPISPAGTTIASGNKLLDLLQAGPQRNAPSIKELEAIGKVTCVNELEARIRQSVGQGHQQHAQHQQPQHHLQQQQQKKSASHKDEELLAFKKLIMQVVSSEGNNSNIINNNNKLIHNSGGSGGGGVGRTNNITSQMLKKQQQQQVDVNTDPAGVKVPHELVYRLLQAQQEERNRQVHQQPQQQQPQQQPELFNKLLLPGNRLLPPNIPSALSPLPPEMQVLVANSQPSVDLLARPESRAILHGLTIGDITPQNLIQQLQNPAQQPRTREVLASILKLIYSPRPASPLLVSPTDPIQQLMMQQMRIPSPLPPMPNAFCPPTVLSPNPLGTGGNTLTVTPAGLGHMVPSQHQLIAHTQQIMQSALLKKKLEEQTVNFRKKQEMQRSNSPNTQAKSPNNNTVTTNMMNPGPVANSTTSNNNINNNNNNNIVNSPPSIVDKNQLAFTPTAVLRKMTAEQQKDNNVVGVGEQGNTTSTTTITNTSAKKMNVPYPLQPQQQQGQAQWAAVGAVSMMSKQPMQGRAIVKGNQNTPQQHQQQQMLAEQQFRNQLAQAQNQHLQYQSNARATAALLSNQQQQQQQHQPKVGLMNSQQANMFNAFPSVAAGRVPNRGAVGSGFAGPVSGHVGMTAAPGPGIPSFLLPHHQQQQQRDVRGGIRNTFAPHPQLQQPQQQQQQYIPGNAGDGDLSNTANSQISHWFNSELLAQGRGVKPEGGVNMVSVEELERLQHNSAPVLN